MINRNFGLFRAPSTRVNLVNCEYLLWLLILIIIMRTKFQRINIIHFENTISNEKTGKMKLVFAIYACANASFDRN